MFKNDNDDIEINLTKEEHNLIFKYLNNSLIKLQMKHLMLFQKLNIYCCQLINLFIIILFLENIKTN